MRTLENTSDLWDLPQYDTQNYCINSMATYNNVQSCWKGGKRGNANFFIEMFFSVKTR